MASSSENSLTGHYAAISTTKEFQQTLPATPAPSNTPQKTAYLIGLRKAAAQMQDDINAFLTLQMEQDKAAAAASGAEGAKARVDEDKEEENYGEEVDDDEA